MSEASASRLHQTLIGAGAVAIGALMAWGATAIPGEAGYSGVGPNFLPWVVSAALVICGAWLVLHARRGGWHDVDPPSGAARGDWPSLAWVAAGIVASAALLTTIGFILACTLCYMLAVRGLRRSEGKPQGGVRGLALDFVTGFLIAGPAFWLFTQLLGINLPGVTGTGWL
jgi:putative tricarboxylic transport membrane protein